MFNRIRPVSLESFRINFVTFKLDSQVCSNAARVYVQRNLYERFVEAVVSRTRAIRVADPFKDTTQMGAIISKPQLDRILQYISGAKKQVLLLCIKRVLQLSKVI